MKIKAKFQDRTRMMQAKENTKVSDVLAELKINPETVIVKRGKEIVMDDEVLENRDEIEIIKVVSGG